MPGRRQSAEEQAQNPDIEDVAEVEVVSESDEEVEDGLRKADNELGGTTHFARLEQPANTAQQDSQELAAMPAVAQQKPQQAAMNGVTGVAVPLEEAKPTISQVTQVL